ncbi:type III pantothenate kinase [Desulfurobacterium sp.]
MITLIDAGNSFIKAVTWNGKTFEKLITIPTKDAGQSFPLKGEKAIISSVVPSLRKMFEKAFKNAIFVNALMSLPVRINYKKPESLGADRIALACGVLDYGDSGIAISAGTTVVVDVIVEKTFIGGIILPGVRAIHKTLTLIAEQLPEVENKLTDTFPGKSTAECIKAGTTLAIKGAIKEITEKYPELPVFFTGGYGKELMEITGKGIYDPLLIFKGLVRILEEK